MKILFFADNFAPERNAQASRVYERAIYWARWGHEVTVITCAPNFPEGKLFAGYTNDWRQVEMVDGIRVVRVKTFIARNEGRWKRMLDFVSFLPSALGCALFEKRPDVVAATSPQFFAALAGWMASVWHRRPFLLELSDLWPASVEAVGALKRGWLMWVLTRLEMFLYARARVIAAQTQAFRRDLLERGVPAAKLAVVLNGVELSMYAPRVRDAALASEWGVGEELVVGYVGTLGMAHGLSGVLDAAESLRGGGVRFLLVGPGAERELLMAEAARRGLTNVTFVESQPKAMMPRVWSLVDVALVHLKDTPVFRTVIPSKIFEAMASGKPVLLAAPAGEASELLAREEAGLHVTSGNVLALATAVQELSTDAERRALMAAAALRAAPRYSRERQARALLDLLEGMADEQKDTVSGRSKAEFHEAGSAVAGVGPRPRL
jgi:colanic acid biosynthesis glycosyl transferase WcaI